MKQQQQTTHARARCTFLVAHAQKGRHAHKRGQVEGEDSKPP